MVKIVQILSRQISCVDCEGGGNSDDWKKKLPESLLSLSGRLLLRTPFTLLSLAMSLVLKEGRASIFHLVV